MARPKVNPEVFATKTPDQAASMLLQHFKGNARMAEVEAWAFWEQYAGGEPFKRRDAEGPEAQYFYHVAWAIVNGTEDPKVERATRTSPFGTFEPAK